MKAIGVALLMLLLAAPVFAQGDCGNGLPCGPIPWRLPVFDELMSPTPITYVIAPTPGEGTPTEAPTETPAPTETFTPSPTPTRFFGDDPDDVLATLSSIVEGTAIPVLDAEGQPVDVADVIGFQSEMGVFFGYAKGLSEGAFGPFSPLIGLLMAGLLIALILRAISLIVPALAAIFGAIRKVVQLILDFIPG